MEVGDGVLVSIARRSAGRQFLTAAVKKAARVGKPLRDVVGGLDSIDRNWGVLSGGKVANVERRHLGASLRNSRDTVASVRRWREELQARVGTAGRFVT